MIYTFILSILRWAARKKLQRLHPRIIAVTGSVGKSTCVSVLDELITPIKKTRTTKKGNSESGLPLEILGIRQELHDYRPMTWLKVVVHALWIGLVGDADSYEVLIAELGIDSPYPPKNMSYLLTVIPHPDIAVVTAVAPVHTQQFADGLSDHDAHDESVILERIAKEKMLLCRATKKGGFAIVPSDNRYVMHEAASMKTPIITVGTNHTATYRIDQVNTTLRNGSTIKFSVDSNSYTMHFSKMAIMTENASIYISAIAAAYCLGIPLAKSIETIEKTSRIPPGRFTVLDGVKETTIIDSSYNASPESMRATLTFLQSLPMKKGRRIAILGDMRELGPLAEQKHRELASSIVSSCDHVVVVGILMRTIVVPELMKLGFDPKHIDVFETASGVGKSLIPILRTGDVILVKGSQNTLFLETAVKELLQHEEDQHLLCRQSTYWDQVRSDFFALHPNKLYAKSTYH